MATDGKKVTPTDKPLAAAALRQSIVDSQAAKARQAAETRDVANRQMQELFREFLENEISQDELDDIRHKILRATEQGQTKVRVLRFSSKLCSDLGRAINNSDRTWPTTLLGKARSFYEFFLERGKPQGFTLTAQILDFPDGKPGDVGLFVGWDA